MKSSPEYIIQGNWKINTSFIRIACRIFTAAFIVTAFGCAMTSMNAPDIVQLPSDKLLTIRTTPTLALSPDGKLIVYPADTVNSDTRLLYLQPVNRQVGRVLEGTMGGETPFFSPDGKWVGFFADGKLKKVSIDGGDPQVICDAKAPSGGAWGVNDTIVFADGAVWQVAAAGGTPRQITQLKPGEQHSWPSLLPNGKLLFNLTQQGQIIPRVVLKQIGSGNRITLLEEGNYPRYTSNGYVIFNENGALKAVALDLNQNRLTSEPAVITDGVLMSLSSGASQYSISQSGALVYVPGTIFGSSRRIVFLDRQGNERDSGLPLRRYSYVVYSPDGQLLAIETDGQILIQNKQDQTILDVIEDATYPAWGPGAGQITFSSVKQGVPGIYKKQVNKRESAELLLTGEYSLDHSFSWSSDGTVLGYTEIRPDTGMNVWLKKSNTPTESILNSSFHECCPVFSPDGLWMAYVSDESGDPQVYLMSLSRPDAKYQLSDKGAREPVWSNTGKELFYWQDRQLMVVELTSDAGIKFSAPKPLLQGVFVSSTSTWRSRYDISPADDEFVIIRRGAEEMGVRELKYIENWTYNLE
jgi:serine/threonine-protein kinase